MCEVWLQGIRIAIVPPCLLALSTVGLLLMAGVASAIGASSSGGGFTTFIKVDFIAGNTTDTRVSGGQQPAASWGGNSTAFCGRLGVLDVLACIGGGNVTPSGFDCTGLIDVFEDYAVTAEGLVTFGLLPVDLEGVLYSPASLSWLDYALVFGVLLIACLVLWFKRKK